MVSPRAKSPETKARKSLEDWLAVNKKRSQQRLADHLGIEQQSVSQWIRRRARPSDEMRAALELATAGAVLAAEWDTPAEARERVLRIARISRSAA